MLTVTRTLPTSPREATKHLHLKAKTVEFRMTEEGMMCDLFVMEPFSVHTIEAKYIIRVENYDEAEFIEGEV